MMDLISRRDVIDAVIKYCTKYDLRELLADIEVLPSVEQAQKTGKWVQKTFTYRCSACQEDSDWPSEYCPWCGAKMEEDQ